METRSIAIINGIEIPAVVENGETYLPIKPICQAIGIDAKVQRTKIQEDSFLAPVGVFITSTGADNHLYEMFCLPLKYIYGWLATINPGRVSPEAREKVIAYRRECYEILYEHFTKTSQRQIETNETEIRQLKIINEAILKEKEFRQIRKEAESELSKIRASRLDDQPTLF